MDSTIATSDSPFADSIASKQNSGTQVAVGPPPNPDSVSAGLAKNIAELAGLFYSSLSVLDSAKYWYDVLLRDHPESQFTPIALYTLAQIASQDSSTSAAMLDSLYRLIIDRYPTSEFADASREILGLSPKEESADEAGGLYERGEQLLNRDSADAAIALFRQIAAYYPESPLAPKAQYAIGWIYEQVYDDADSAIANYERLVTKFPSTPYAVEVSAKLQAVRAGQGGTSQGGPQEDMTPPSPPQPPTQPGGLPPGKTTPLSRPQDPELAEPDTLMEDEPLEEPDPR
jgi:TolA-binding protein